MKKTGDVVMATEIVDILKKEDGCEFKVNFDGAWDRYKVSNVKTITINKGGGFEEAVKVDGPEGGSFIYMSPYRIECMPTEDTMFLFFASDGSFYMKDK